MQVQSAAVCRTGNSKRQNSKVAPPFPQTPSYFLLVSVAAALQHVVPPGPLASSENSQRKH